MSDGISRQGRHFGKLLFGAGLLLVALCHGGTVVQAEEFLGVEIEKISRTYVVARDVNVRAKPSTSAKRVDGLKKGERVYVVGHFKGWLAIMDDNKPVGFAYQKYLVPMISGELEQPVRGSATIDDDGKCAYEIAYSGRSTANGDEFGMADYEIQVQCERDGDTMAFMMFMFMTEGAYIRSKPNIHQIGIDLLEINADNEHDGYFTTNVFFNAAKGKAVFSDISPEAYAGKPAEEEAAAETIPEALNVAVQMALESWNGKAWDDLAEALANE